MEVAEKLPSGTSDFWDTTATRSLESMDTDPDADKASNIYVSVYPNPLRKNEVLQLRVGVEQSQKAHIELVDFSGRIVKHYDSDIYTGENNLSLDTQGVASGGYILVFNSESINVSRRIMIIE